MPPEFRFAVETAETLVFSSEPQELPLELWEHFFGEFGVTFVAGEAHHFFFDIHAEGCIEQIRDRLPLALKRLRPRRRGGLHRVK